jgi:hypothetical protein
VEHISSEHDRCWIELVTKGFDAVTDLVGPGKRDLDRCARLPTDVEIGDDDGVGSVEIDPSVSEAEIGCRRWPHAHTVASGGANKTALPAGDWFARGIADPSGFLFCRWKQEV